MSRVMSVKAQDFQSTTTIEVLYTTDNTCHRCGCALPDITPKAFFSRDNYQSFVYLVFECPKCHNAFVCEYPILSEYICRMHVDLTDITARIFPSLNPCSVFGNEINSLSPQFVKVYHESEEAEAQGLSEICGMGYRKALEFLVKDYLCKTYPNDANAIKNEFLSETIQRIEDLNIKTLAERCAWLGNDETHYVRRREDYKLEDLKRFIHALVYFLQAQLAVQDALSIKKLK